MPQSVLRSRCRRCSGPWAGSRSPHGHGCGFLLFPMLHFSRGWERKERQKEQVGAGVGVRLQEKTMGFVKSLSGQSGQVQWLQAT